MALHRWGSYLGCSVSASELLAFRFLASLQGMGDLHILWLWWEMQRSSKWGKTCSTELSAMQSFRAKDLSMTLLCKVFFSAFAFLMLQLASYSRDQSTSNVMRLQNNHPLHFGALPFLKRQFGCKCTTGSSTFALPLRHTRV